MYQIVNAMLACILASAMICQSLMAAGVDFYDGGPIDHNVGSSPLSVAVGDFNVDGRPDLAVANSGNNSVSILLGIGAGNFAAPTSYAVGSSPCSIVVGDFNGDGKLDLVVANSISYDVSVLLGTGSGTFAPAVNIALGNSPISLATADFNGDGKLDIAIANNFSNVVSVLLGNGTGGFAVPAYFAAGTNTHALVANDLNNDGKIDLAVASDNAVSVLLGTGTGSFALPVNYSAPGMNPTSIAVGDFDGDGSIDLVAGSPVNTNFGILYGHGTGSFDLPPTFIGVGGLPLSVAVGDFDDDGISDITVANHDSDNVSVMFTTFSSGHYGETYYPMGAGPACVAVADFNQDGKLDIVTVNETGNSASVLLNKGAGVFGTATMLPAGVGPGTLALGDFNGDGELDVAVPNIGDSTVTVYLGSHDGNFGAATTFATGNSPFSVVVGDFNKDGKADLATANYNGSSISVLLGTGTGSFGSATAFTVGVRPQSLAVGDFNVDGKLDIVVTNSSDNKISVLLGTGTGGFNPATNIPVGNSPCSVAVGDFNGDSKLDLVVANYTGFNISVLLGTGFGGFTLQSTTSVDKFPSSVAVADLNGDGKLDIVVANAVGNDVSVLLGMGAGNFGPVTNYAAGNGPYGVAIGDFNKDGKPDIAVANQDTNNVSVLLGTGTGSFGAAVNFVAGTSPIAVAVGDFNRDGKMDLAVGNNGSANASILLNITREQAIDFGPLPDKVFGDVPFAINATATSNLPLTFIVDSGPATVSGNTLTLTGVGSVTIRASQLGSGVFAPAPDVLRTFNVKKADQTITFAPLSDKTFGDASFTVSAIGGASGNPVTFAVSGPATIDAANVLTITGAGDVSVTASQTGNANYTAALSVVRTFHVAKAAQTITFAALSDKTYDDPAFTVSATGGASGIPVTFTVTGPATIDSANQVTLTGVGIVTITASQAGNAEYLAAQPVAHSFNVAKAAQIITFVALSDKIYGDPAFTVSATGGASGIPVTFTVTGPATIDSSNQITLTGVGTVIVTASQGGNAEYLAAQPVAHSFNVAKAAQIITFVALSDKIYGDPAFTVSATGGASGNTVTFAISGPATIAGSTITITGVGLVTVTASQMGNADYLSAANEVRTFKVLKPTPVITWVKPDDIVSGTALSGTQLNATANVGGEFAYTPAEGTVLARGANQSLHVDFTPADSANYNAASSNVSIDVLDASPTFVSLPTTQPNPSRTGQSVMLTAAGGDNDNDALMYSWDFGDNTSGSGAKTTHIFSAPGTYTVSVIVNDGQGGSVTASISQIVVSAGSAGAIDTDGDGFTDAIETASGSSASNAADTPTGGAAADPLPLADAKLSIKLNFAKPALDAITLSGTIVVPDGFSISGARLLADIGGVAKSFTLNKRGRNRNGGDSASVKNKGTSARNAKFALKLMRGNFAETLHSIGLTNNDITKDVTTPLMVVFAGNVFTKVQSQSYKAKAGKSGVTKDQK